jgi:hypothetical protein
MSISVIIFFGEKREDLWEYDYITEDLLPKCSKNIKFASYSNLNTFNQNCDVFVYSCRDPQNYHWGFMPTYDQVLEAVQKLKPKIIIQVSDEFEHEDNSAHNNLANYCEIFLRNYHHSNYSYLNNTLHIPLGHKNDFDILNKKITPVLEREYNWCFVGQKKSDREDLVNSFSSIPDHYCLIHDGNENQKIDGNQIADYYLNSIFVPCSRGWTTLNTMRIYEASMCGAIPVVVGTKEEIDIDFKCEDSPPFIFSDTWESATSTCKSLLEHPDILIEKQKQILKWWNTRMEKIKFKISEVLNIDDKLRDIPTINCISLEESEDRRKLFLEQFKEYGVEHKVKFHISEKFGEVKEVLEFDEGFEDKSCDGNKSIFVAHLKNIKNWYDNTDEEYALFCEDDLGLDPVQYWNFTWQDFVEHLPNDWECVQLSYTGETFSEHMIRLQKRRWYFWGNQSLLIKREYAKKLLDLYYKEDRIIMKVQDHEPFYYKGYSFYPDFHLYPYAETLLLRGIGNVYCLPLFVENVELEATFHLNNPDFYKEKQKPGHYESHAIAIQWWKNVGHKKSIQELTTMIKIIDYFPYFDETGRELLDFRVNLLKDHVDLFVICESNKTQSGLLTKPGLRDAIKQYNLPEEKIRIIDLEIPDDDQLDIQEIDYINCHENNFLDINSLRARCRERMQKNAILSVLDDYDDDCMIIHSDSDEILDPKYIQDIKNVLQLNPNGYLILPLSYHEHKANLRLHHKSTNLPVYWAIIATNRSMFKKITPIEVRADLVPQELGFYTLNMIDLNGNIIPTLGWHLSWMGDKKRKSIKSKSFTHFNDTLSFLKDARYENETIDEEYKVDSIPPCGNINYVLKEYPLSNLPDLMVNTPRMREFFISESIHHEPKYNFNVSSEPKTSLIVCEDFYEDPHAVREYALSLDFEESDYHRGRRTPQQHIFPGIKEKFEQLLGKKIIRWNETYGMCGRFQYCTAEDAIVYHGDAQQWAAVIYLTPDAPYETGTSLLVHKKTGTRHCSDPRIWEAWKDTAPTGLYLDGTPWDEIDKVGNVFNRLIIWDGHCPHAASKYFGFTKETARLFHIFFFDTDETPSWIK